MTSSDTKHKFIQYLFLFFNIVWVSVFMIVIMNRTYPLIGHDYTYFLSRLFDTYLHYRVNGFSIQWYTPSFGGGLPAYANPQQAQFSLPQLLAVFVDPWKAYIISIVIYGAIGIWSFYIFAKNVLNLDWRASLLGALFFLFTGFYIGHSIAGQEGFLGFPLLSAVILALFWKPWSDLLAGIAIGILTASLLYHAGFYTLTIFVLSCGITLPLLYLTQPHLFSFASLSRRLVIAGIFFVGLSASKVYAIYTFMRYFPREITYQYSSEYVHSLTQPIVFFFAQLLGTTTLAPWLTITGQSANSVQYLLSNLSGYPYSYLWETDNAISPVLILVFILAAIQHVRSGKKIDTKGLSKDKIIALVLLLLVTWLSIEYILGKGWIYFIAKHLPVFKSLHINYRFTSVLFFPLALVGAFILHSWFHESNPRKAYIGFMVLNILTLISPLSYYLYTDDVHFRAFDVTKLLTAYQQSQHGETFPVELVADKNVRDWNAFLLDATTIQPYEAVFGYDLRDFKPQLHAGPVFDVTAGHFNMTNPASLTFPAQNGGVIFSRFDTSDRIRLEQFLQRRQPDWHIPAIQIVCDYVSVITFFLCLAVILFHLFQATHTRYSPSKP